MARPSQLPKINGSVTEFASGPLRVVLTPECEPSCVDVLRWNGEIFKRGAPAGRMLVFEIDHPRLRDRGIGLGKVLDGCLGGGYQTLIASESRRLWQGQSRLVVIESMKLFPLARRQGLSIPLVRETVSQFRDRGAGAFVMKPVPLQYVENVTGKWLAEMGPLIGDREWFLPKWTDGDPEAGRKVEAHWRTLGWNEVHGSFGERIFLLEVAE